jgi:HEAT repeat protein
MTDESVPAASPSSQACPREKSKACRTWVVGVFAGVALLSAACSPEATDTRKSEAPTAGRVSERERVAASHLVRPRSHLVAFILDDLRAAGVRPIFLSGLEQMCLVPPDMRRRAVAPKELLNKIAQRRGLSVLWKKWDGREYALVYRAAPSAEFREVIAGLTAESGDPGKVTPEVSKRIAQLVAALGSRDFHAREKAADAIVQYRLAALPALKKAVVSDDAEVVSRAKKAIAIISENVSPGRLYWVEWADSLQDPRLLPALVSAAGSSDRKLAERARLAVRNCSWAGAVLLAGDRGWKLVSRTCRDSEWRTDGAVIEALGLLGDQRSLKLLEERLGHKKENRIWHIVRALGWTRRSRATELLIRLASKPNVSERNQIAWSLGAAGGLEVLPALERLLGHKDKWVRYPAVWSAGSLRSARVLPMLRRAMRDPDGGIQQLAVRTLCRVPGPQALALVEESARSSDRYLRAGAAVPLAMEKDKVARALLDKLLVDRESSVRAEAAAATQWLPRAQALAAAKDRLSDPHKYVRMRAAVALGAMGGEEVLPVLREALKDESKDVRRCAVSAMGESACPEAIEFLAAALSHRAADVRRNVLGVLRHYPDKLAQPLLKKALNDQVGEVRKLAVHYLGTSGKPQARQLLLAALAVAANDEERNIIMAALCNRWPWHHEVRKAMWHMGWIGKGKPKE